MHVAIIYLGFCVSYFCLKFLDNLVPLWRRREAVLFAPIITYTYLHTLLIPSLKHTHSKLYILHQHFVLLTRVRLSQKSDYSVELTGTHLDWS